MAITSLVLKVASRCNLNCSYCYMYNLGDTTYKNQPKVMEKSTVDNILNSVSEYTKKIRLKIFNLSFMAENHYLPHCNGMNIL